jgi:oligoendopeptidase F
LSKLRTGTPEERIEELEVRVRKFERSLKRLDPGMPRRDFLDILREYDELKTQINRLNNGEFLKWTEDTTDDQALRINLVTDRFTGEVESRTDYLEHWIQTCLEEEDFRRLCPKKGELARWLNHIRSSRKYELRWHEEKAITLKDAVGIGQMSNIYEYLIKTLRFHPLINGRRRGMSESELEGRFEDRKRENRFNAYEEVHRRYARLLQPLGAIYISTVMDLYTEVVKMRGYASPLSLANHINELDDETVDVFLDVCRSHRRVFQRYFEVKRRLCGIRGRFNRVDLFAPIQDARRFRFTFDQAARLVVEAFEDFSPKYASLARQILETPNIHSAPGEAKYGGAYCLATGPEDPPFVMQSFSGHLSDVFTLAHELGHGIHALLGGKKHKTLWEPVDITGETAAIFSELLVRDKLLRNADERTRKQLMACFLDEDYSTLQRQVSFVDFEIEAHEMINSARSASPEELCDLYYSNLERQLGRSVVIPEHFRYEWLKLDRFFEDPFSTYSYGFGLMMAMAMHSNYMYRRGAYVKDHFRFLSAADSVTPKDVAAIVDMNISSRNLGESAYRSIDRRVKKLAQLT